MASAGTNQCQSHDVLRDLLHFVSQPLTTLHCVLESSLAQDEVEHTEDIFLALEQTERVIGAVRLMREYLEAEQVCSSTVPVPLGPLVDMVLQQLAALAETRGVHLFGSGVSKAVIPARHDWLQRALLYLVGALIEREPPGRAITVLIEDGRTQSVISGHSFLAKPSLDCAPPPAPDSSVLRQVKIAIAQRALESAGALVQFYSDDRPGFTIRIPRSGSALNELSA